MKHLAAFALLNLGGNENPKAADVEKLLKAAGVSSDADKVEAMMKAFEGKKFHEAVDEGLAKMATMGSGAPAAGGASVAAAAPKEEEKKDEPEDVPYRHLLAHPSSPLPLEQQRQLRLLRQLERQIPWWPFWQDPHRRLRGISFPQMLSSWLRPYRHRRRHRR